MSSAELMLQVTSVSKRFGAAESGVLALENLSLEVRRGSLLAIVGPSGCGKSTLLRILAGVEKKTAGDIELVGGGVPGPPTSTIVFQQDGLLPWKRIEDNVALGLRIRGVARAEGRKRARVALERYGLGAFASRFPRELSVGMQQRVALLRAFLMEAPLLLLDEPFASVDAQTRRVLQDELDRERRRTGATVVLVTHDIQEALRLADTVCVMSDRPGRIVDTIAVPARTGDGSEARNRAELHDLRQRIWSQIETSVRSALGVAGS